MAMHLVADQESLMGKVFVDLELANSFDEEETRRGLRSSGEVRHATIRALVDSGATELVLPQSVVARLGLESTGQVSVRFANEQRASLDLVEGIRLRLLGRTAIVRAVIVPAKEYALLGAIPLEMLDLYVDCRHQAVFPHPESPDLPLCEI